MKKIASFTVDHTKIPRGMFISRVDGDVVTYDIRTRVPNREPVMDNAAIHTLEHLFATYARGGEFTEHIIYFGPMGCRTGFYLLVRNMAPADAIYLTRSAFEFIKDYAGEIPGASEGECGNWLEHDLEGARREAAAMAGVLAGWKEDMLDYGKNKKSE